MELRKIEASEVTRLEPLWHEHLYWLSRSAPDLGPYTAPESSWGLRERKHRKLLDEGGKITLAWEGEADLGYVAWQRTDMAWNATFDAPAKLAELTTLVLPSDDRLGAVADALLDEVDVQVREAGLKSLCVGLLPHEKAKQEALLRAGYTRGWLTLRRQGFPSKRKKPSPALPIDRVSPEDVDALRDLCLMMHSHHQAVAPQFAPFVTDEVCWSVFREIFKRSAENGLLLAARDERTPVGVACAAIHSHEDAFGDVWQSGARVGETKVLSVDAHYRGRGVGTALLDAVEAVFAEQGIRDHHIGVIEPNAGAIRLYQRYGFKPAWLEMIRLPARIPPESQNNRARA